MKWTIPTQKDVNSLVWMLGYNGEVCLCKLISFESPYNHSSQNFQADYILNQQGTTRIAPLPSDFKTAYEKEDDESETNWTNLLKKELQLDGCAESRSGVETIKITTAELLKSDADYCKLKFNNIKKFTIYHANFEKREMEIYLTSNSIEEIINEASKPIYTEILNPLELFQLRISVEVPTPQMSEEEYAEYLSNQ
jgi:hypothetical protein